MSDSRFDATCWTCRPPRLDLVRSTDLKNASTCAFTALGEE